MADNIISQYYTKNDGSQIGNDAQLINGVYQNEKIINKNSGEKFVKSSNYRNVFDKVDEKISKIDDANANGVCSCKNASGVEVDTFKCHVPVSNSAPTLSWGQTSTIGSIDGKPLTVKLPPNPNTDTNTTYSAGTGLVLNGTTFHIDEIWLKNFIGNNSSPNLEIQTAIFSSVPVFGTSSDRQTSMVGQNYAGSVLYKNVSRSGKGEDSILEFRDSLSGTWKCITESLVEASSTEVQTGPTVYELYYRFGTFCKV